VVLTKGAVEGASEESQGKNLPTWIIMVKGFFLDGVQGGGGDSAVKGVNHGIPVIDPGTADSGLSRL
jgi:hypothetical protein